MGDCVVVFVLLLLFFLCFECCDYLWNYGEYVFDDFEVGDVEDWCFWVFVDGDDVF